MKVAVVIVAVIAALLSGALVRNRPQVRRIMLFTLGLLPFTGLVSPLSVNIVSHELYRGYARGFEVTVVDVLAVALAATLPKARYPAPYRAFAFLFIGSAAASVFYAASTLYAGFGLWKLLRGYFLAVVLARACEDRYAPPALLTGLAWGVVLQLGFAVYDRYVLGFHQVTGSFAHQNSLGMAVNMVVPVFFSLLLGYGTKKWLAAAAVGAGAVCVVLTLSRGSIVMLPTALGIVYLGSLMREATARKFQIGVAGLFVALALVLKAIDTIVQRFVRAPEASMEGREKFEEAAASIVGDYPFGVGVNNFSYVMGEYGYGAAADLPRYDTDALVHHVYWLTAAELGYHGLIAWLLLVLAPLVLALRGARRAGVEVRGDVLLGAFAGLFVTAVHGLFEWIVLQTNAMYLMWTQSVLILTLYRQLREDSVASRP